MYKNKEREKGLKFEILLLGLDRYQFLKESMTKWDFARETVVMCRV